MITKNKYGRERIVPTLLTLGERILIITVASIIFISLSFQIIENAIVN